jgi:selenoprotein W-related protein
VVSEWSATISGYHQPVPARPIKVDIVYCAECGYDHEALDLTAALMKEFHMYLSGITLVPESSGAFDVRVDGDLVHSMYRDGGFGERDKILASIREKLS